MVKIIYIEDNYGDFVLVKEYLKEKSSDFSVKHAGSLKEGLAELQKTEADIVLLDLGLPDSEGIDSFKTLCEQENSKPVIVITGIDDEAVGIEAVRLGAQDYLVKGQYNSQMLMRAINYSIERKKLIQAQEKYIEELEKLNKLMINRELTIHKLKEEISELKKKTTETASKGLC